MENLLPYEGQVYYYGKVMDHTEAQDYLNSLLSEIPWQQDEVMMFGKKIRTVREIAWFAENAYTYKYSGVTKKAAAFTPLLLELKALAEKTSGERFNACLLNLYHHGGEGMAWHSDAEKDLEKHAAIASFSFGAERRFGFKHKKTAEKVYQVLEHGSLLIMKGETQDNWLHRLPPVKNISAPRVNLTFRKMVK